MAINPEEIDVTTVDKLDDLNLALGNFFAHTNLNGKLGKATINQLATFLAPYVTAIGGSGFVATTGTVLPAASAGKFTIVGAGTFTQTTGGNVVTTELLNILGSSATTWSLVKAIPLPSNIALKTDIQYKGTYDSIALALAGVPLAQRKLGDTIGIKENGSVVEYWFEEATTDASLVKKGSPEVYTKKINFSDLLPGSLTSTTGEPSVNTQYSRTLTTTRCNPGQKIEYELLLKLGGTYAFWFFNAASQMIGFSVPTGSGTNARIFKGVTEAPSGTYYFRTYTMNNTHPEYIPYDFKLDLVGSNYKAEQSYKFATDLSNFTTVVNELKFSDLVVGSIKTNGTDGTRTDYSRSAGSYYCNAGDIIDITARIGNDQYGLIFYNKKGAMLTQQLNFGYDGTGSRRVVAPAMAKYYRVQTMNQTHANYKAYTFSLKQTRVSSKKGYKAIFSAITEPGALNSMRDYYPTLKAIKVSNLRDNNQPLPVAWLYHSNEEIPKFYIAEGKPDAPLRFLFNWDKSLTNNGNRKPDDYAMYITAEGDIICTFRTEIMTSSGTNIVANDSVRSNPIVYPASDYNAPYVVDFGSEIQKPSAWLQNSGAEYMYTDDFFMFAEYTRPITSKSYVWKVTKPFNNPANWRRVKEFTVSRDTNSGWKHCHCINRDPFTGHIYLSTGDDDTAAAIYVSIDKGETFQPIIVGNEKIARQINFIFKDDFVYWATDSGAENYHFLFSVKRNPTTGIIDMSTLKELYEYPYRSGINQASYGLAYIKEHDALLAMDRTDGARSDNLMLYMWSIPDAKMYIVAEIFGFRDAYTGFRGECIGWTQAVNDRRIMVGFGMDQNAMDLLGNDQGSNNRLKVCNMGLEIIEVN